MLKHRFGIEIEFTGITRERAAAVAAEFLGGSADYRNHVKAPDGRVWKFVRDASVTPKRKERGRVISASDDYKVELVSPGPACTVRKP